MERLGAGGRQPLLPIHPLPTAGVLRVQRPQAPWTPSAAVQGPQATSLPARALPPLLPAAPLQAWRQRRALSRPRLQLRSALAPAARRSWLPLARCRTLRRPRASPRAWQTRLHAGSSTWPRVVAAASQPAHQTRQPPLPQPTRSPALLRQRRRRRPSSRSGRRAKQCWRRGRAWQRRMLYCARRRPSGASCGSWQTGWWGWKGAGGARRSACCGRLATRWDVGGVAWAAGIMGCMRSTGVHARTRNSL